MSLFMTGYLAFTAVLFLAYVAYVLVELKRWRS